jgi:hypothetical protein
VSIPAARVLEAKEKSSWIKRDGVYMKSMKFLGLENIPKGVKALEEDSISTKERLRSFTRSGGRMEFTEEMQYLCWMSKSWKSKLDILLEKGVNSKEGAELLRKE